VYVRSFAFVCISRVDNFRILQMEDGKLRKILNVTQEVKGRGKLRSRVMCSGEGCAVCMSALPGNLMRRTLGLTQER